jgi:hypothetical protein
MLTLKTLMTILEHLYFYNMISHYRVSFILFFFNDTKVIQFKHILIPYIILKNQKSLASQCPLWECNLKIMNDIPLELSFGTINGKILKPLSIILLECQILKHVPQLLTKGARTSR